MQHFIFSVETCEQQTKNGRQLAAEALLCMESPSTSSEGKTFLQGILQQQQNGRPNTNMSDLRRMQLCIRFNCPFFLFVLQSRRSRFIDYWKNEDFVMQLYVKSCVTNVIGRWSKNKQVCFCRHTEILRELTLPYTLLID